MALLEAMSGVPERIHGDELPDSPIFRSKGRRRGTTREQRARVLGWLSYGALVAGALLYVLAIWVQVYVDTRRMHEVAHDRITESHRNWRLRTALVFLLWSILGGLAIPIGIGWFVLIPAWLWYVYRLARGLSCYARRRAIEPQRWRWVPGGLWPAPWDLRRRG